MVKRAVCIGLRLFKFEFEFEFEFGIRFGLDLGLEYCGDL